MGYPCDNMKWYEPGWNINSDTTWQKTSHQNASNTRHGSVSHRSDSGSLRFSPKKSTKELFRLFPLSHLSHLMSAPPSFTSDFQASPHFLQVPTPSSVLASRAGVTSRHSILIIINLNFHHLHTLLCFGIQTWGDITSQRSCVWCLVWWVWWVWWVW